MARKPASSELVHGTTVSLNGGGVLIRGKPGSGKSDLALQLIESFGTGLSELPVMGTLVSDDQTELYLSGTELRATPPKAIAGKLEVRGFTILELPHETDVPLLLVVDLLAANKIERLPARPSMETTLLGQRIARMDVDPTSASAAARVRLALMRVKLRDASGA
jgi:HPr kinase/phosphorylase